MKAWAIKSPDGKIYPWTADYNKFYCIRRFIKSGYDFNEESIRKWKFYFKKGYRAVRVEIKIAEADLAEAERLAKIVGAALSFFINVPEGVNSDDYKHKLKDFMNNMTGLDPDIISSINKNFWDLFD